MTIKKQIRHPLILIGHGVLPVSLFAFLAMQALLVGLVGSTNSVYAAAEPGCYTTSTNGTTEKVKKFSYCSPPVTQAQIDAGKCFRAYIGDAGQTPYNETPCSDITVQSIDYSDPQSSSASCQSAQGEWLSAESRCVCPSGKKFNSDKTRCIPKNQSSSGGSTIPAPTEAKTDCQVKDSDGNSQDLDEDTCGIVDLLNTAFNFVAGGVAIAVIVNIIYAGIQYSTAQGDPSVAAKSKTRIRNALFAFVMYLSLYAFIQWLIPGGVF